MTDIVAPTLEFTLAPIKGWPPETEEVSAHLPTVAPEQHQKINRLARLTDQDISDLAWDLVLFNDMDKSRIMASYAMTVDDVADLQQLPLFTAESANAKKALQADPHLGVRRMAKSFLVQRVSTLNELATSPVVEPAVRLKAIDQLARIAGLDKATEEKKGGGVAVQINLGGNIFGATPQQEVKAFINGDF